MTAKKIELQAERRTIVGKKVKRSRAKGLLPAVVYGHGQESTPIFIDEREFRKTYKEAGTSALIDLTIDEDKAIKVLLHEPQEHYRHGGPVHADFYAVKMTEKIETAIPIHFTGTSAAVEELEGNLIINKDELEIRCLPADLIPAVEVDLSALATFDDSIRVSDIKVPETIEIMLDPEEVIATVAAPISEEELEAELATDTTEAEAAAVEELGKEEAPAEGEAAEGESNEEKSE
jgi:large subunit ribosomal protein L25